MHYFLLWWFYIGIIRYSPSSKSSFLYSFCLVSDINSFIKSLTLLWAMEISHQQETLLRIAVESHWVWNHSIRGLSPSVIWPYCLFISILFTIPRYLRLFYCELSVASCLTKVTNPFCSFFPLVSLASFLFSFHLFSLSGRDIQHC